jgi:hypothetical protein
MTKHLGTLSLAAMAIALTPESTLAKDGVPIQASFTVAFTRTLNSNNALYCGTASLPYAVVANGAGYSALGALSLELLKTLEAPGTMQGCITFKSADGDALYANYGGMIAGANGEGTLTFTGGTGRFQGATGIARFRGIFAGLYPLLTIFGGGTIPYIQGTAVYMVEGIVYLNHERENRNDQDQRGERRNP